MHTCTYVYVGACVCIYIYTWVYTYDIFHHSDIRGKTSVM